MNEKYIFNGGSHLAEAVPNLDCWESNFLVNVVDGIALCKVPCQNIQLKKLKYICKFSRYESSVACAMEIRVTTILHEHCSFVMAICCSKVSLVLQR